MPYRSTIRTCRFVGDVDETMHDELVYMKDNQGTTTYMYMYTFIILSCICLFECQVVLR